MRVVSAKPVGFPWAITLAALVFANGCDGVSYELEKYRSARQSRSALALAKYLEDDLNHAHKTEAAALLDKHFEFALSRAGTHHNAELIGTLLGYLRAARDPRIAVNSIGPPTLARELSPTTTRYFEGSHSWSYDFAKGASLGACAILDHEIIVFESPGSISFDAEHAGLRVDVEWSVHPSGILFSGPVSIVNMGEEPAPVEGIGVEVTLRFEPTTVSTRLDQAHLPPTALVVTGKGVARAGFGYTALAGMADEDDVYSGMAAAAFADAVRQILE